MALWDFRPKGDMWTGLAIGAAIVLAPVILPVIGAALRPVVKAGLRGGMLLYEKGREVAGEISEMA